ncbi:hypothetical protein [Streptomyces sp. NPDC055709]
MPLTVRYTAVDAEGFITLDSGDRYGSADEAGKAVYGTRRCAATRTSTPGSRTPHAAALARAGHEPHEPRRQEPQLCRTTPSK